MSPPDPALIDPTSTAAGEHWYIYYKVPSAQVGALAAAVRRMQRDLESDDVSATLQMRVDVVDGIATLMECYAGIADVAAFGRKLDAAVAASGVPVDLRGARRVERFTAL